MRKFFDYPMDIHSLALAAKDAAQPSIKRGQALKPSGRTAGFRTEKMRFGAGFR